MKLMKYLSALLLLSSSMNALAQSPPTGLGCCYAPNWYKGYVPSAFEWQVMWSNKLGYFPAGLPVALGGTGATNATDARTNLGITAGGFTTQNPNRVFAGPTSGGLALPTFRALVGADLPSPSTSTLGGVQSNVAVTSQWIRSINGSGVPVLSQPTFSDIGGSAVTNQLPTLNAANIWVGNGSNNATGVAVSGDVSITNAGVVTVSKTGGVSFAASATTDTTNAANISSGNLSVNRFNGGSGASSATFLRGDGTWSAGFSIPIGACVPYGGASAPTDWVFPFGQAINRTTFAALFAIYGTAFGVGDGSTTFNVPDLRGTLPAGKDNMGGSAANKLTSTTMTPDGVTLGATGGSQTQTASTTSSGSTSGTMAGTTGAPSATVSTLQGGGSDSNPANATHTHNVTVSGTLGVSASGTSSAFSNIQPTLIMNYICRVN